MRVGYSQNSCLFLLTEKNEMLPAKMVKPLLIGSQPKQLGNTIGLFIGLNGVCFTGEYCCQFTV